MAREFRTDLLGPGKWRDRFTDKGRVKRECGGKWSFQVAAKSITHTEPGRVWFSEDPDPVQVLVWTTGPLGWMHDLKTLPVGTPFDDALAATGLPGFLGWDRETDEEG